MFSTESRVLGVSMNMLFGFHHSRSAECRSAAAAQEQAELHRSLGEELLSAQQKRRDTKNLCSKSMILVKL